ncbi:MAG: EcsC family protein, partial [Ilumatobacter sp.]
MASSRSFDNGRRRTVGESTVVGPPVAEQLVDAIDRAVETRWAAAQERARNLPGLDREERVDAVTARIRRELGAAGAASGGTAAIPGVGVGTVAATFAVELGWSTMRLADLILTIAAIHGHDRADVDERRMWVLSILTYRDGAAGMIAKLAAEMGETTTRRGTRRLTNASVRRINATMGRAVIAKYGARRGVAALGRAVPFGVGAVLGYGMNTRAVSITAKHAHGFFTEFPI